MREREKQALWSEIVHRYGEKAKFTDDDWSKYYAKFLRSWDEGHAVIMLKEKDLREAVRKRQSVAIEKMKSLPAFRPITRRSSHLQQSQKSEDSDECLPLASLKKKVTFSGGSPTEVSALETPKVKRKRGRPSSGSRQQLIQNAKDQANSKTTTISKPMPKKSPKKPLHQQKETESMAKKKKVLEEKIEAAVPVTEPVRRKTRNSAVKVVSSLMEIMSSNQPLLLPQISDKPSAHLPPMAINLTKAKNKSKKDTTREKINLSIAEKYGPILAPSIYNSIRYDHNYNKAPTLHNGYTGTTTTNDIEVEELLVDDALEMTSSFMDVNVDLCEILQSDNTVNEINMFNCLNGADERLQDNKIEQYIRNFESEMPDIHLDCFDQSDERHQSEKMAIVRMPELNHQMDHIKQLEVEKSPVKQLNIDLAVDSPKNLLENSKEKVNKVVQLSVKTLNMDLAVDSPQNSDVKQAGKSPLDSDVNPNPVDSVELKTVENSEILNKMTNYNDQLEVENLPQKLDRNHNLPEDKTSLELKADKNSELLEKIDPHLEVEKSPQKLDENAKEKIPLEPKATDIDYPNDRLELEELLKSQQKLKKNLVTESCIDKIPLDKLEAQNQNQLETPKKSIEKQLPIDKTPLELEASVNMDLNYDFEDDDDDVLSVAASCYDFEDFFDEIPKEKVQQQQHVGKQKMKSPIGSGANSSPFRIPKASSQKLQEQPKVLQTSYKATESEPARSVTHTSSMPAEVTSLLTKPPPTNPPLDVSLQRAQALAARRPSVCSPVFAPPYRLPQIPNSEDPRNIASGCPDYFNSFKFEIFGIKCWRNLENSCQKLDCHHQLYNIGEVVRRLIRLDENELISSYECVRDSGILFRQYLSCYVDIFANRRLFRCLTQIIADCRLYRELSAPFLSCIYAAFQQYGKEAEGLKWIMHYLWLPSKANKFIQLTETILNILASANWSDYMVELIDLFKNYRFPMPNDFMTTIVSTAMQKRELLQSALQLVLLRRVDGVYDEALVKALHMLAQSGNGSHPGSTASSFQQPRPHPYRRQSLNSFVGHQFVSRSQARLLSVDCLRPNGNGVAAGWYPSVNYNHDHDMI